MLSICVLPEKRGSGIASDLIKRFEQNGKQKGREFCVLTVKKDNKRGINFYDKHGYKMKLQKESVLSMIKKL